MKKDEHICPRRSEVNPHAPEKTDTWRKEGGLLLCSYCGSLHPEQALERIKAADMVCPTDKNYKIYIDVPNPCAGKYTIKGMATHKPSGDGWRKITVWNYLFLRVRYGLAPRALRMGLYILLGTESKRMSQKFYFQHFDEAQKKEFIDLLNANKIKVDYPGHFYTKPFFIK